MTYFSEDTKDHYVTNKKFENSIHSYYIGSHEGTLMSKGLGKKGWNFKETSLDWQTWEILPVIAKNSLSLLEEQFNKLANKWKSDTAGYSTTLHITRHDSYLEIIGMGDKALPMILNDLKNEPNHWFVALKAISKVNPVPEEDIGNIEKMRIHWLKWGQANGLI